MKGNNRQAKPYGLGPRILTATLALQLAIACSGAALAGASGAVQPSPPPAPSDALQRTSASVSSVVKTLPPNMASVAASSSPSFIAASEPIPALPPAAFPKTATPTVSLIAKTTPTTPAIVSTAPPLPPIPTPTPSPAPTRPFKFSYYPPLSVEEANSLIRAGVDILNITDTPTLVARCRKVGEMIEATSNYLNVRDQRHSASSAYTWHFIDSQKVDGPGIDRDEFHAQPVISKVSAISFAAEFGNVYVHSVEVFDASGKATAFTLDRLIEENYPRYTICYLFFPTVVQKVVMHYQARGGSVRTPRLAVFAGVARQEEYLKQALWYLSCARREADLAARNPESAAPHVEAACQNLRHAAGRLVRFQVKRTM